MTYLHIPLLPLRERLYRSSIWPIVLWRLYRTLRFNQEIKRRRALRIARLWVHRWIWGEMDVPWELGCPRSMIEPLAELMVESDLLDYISSHPGATVTQASEALFGVPP